MKIKSSPLKFIDFFILQSGFSFVKPKSKKNNLIALFDNYESDIDFSLKHESEDVLLVFVKININNGSKHKEGYQIFAEGVAVFDVKAVKTMSEKNKSSLLFYSALSIAINNIRNYISQLTSSAPLGKYILPTVDVADLHTQKLTHLNKNKKR